MGDQSPQSVSVAIVDDHPVLRRGLSDLIADEADLHLVGEASTLEEADHLIAERASEIDVLILDIGLPDGSGLSLLRELRTEESAIAVLVLTRHGERMYGLRSVHAGARGFMEKGIDPAEIVEGARRVAAGEIVVPSSLEEQVLRRFSRGEDGGQHPLSTLSDREFEVFELLGRGESPAEIAETLDLSPKTIHTYRQRILEKLDLDSSRELLRYAISWMEDVA